MYQYQVCIQNISLDVNSKGCWISTSGLMLDTTYIISQHYCGQIKTLHAQIYRCVYFKGDDFCLRLTEWQWIYIVYISRLWGYCGCLRHYKGHQMWWLGGGFKEGQLKPNAKIHSHKWLMYSFAGFNCLNKSRRKLKIQIKPLNI